MKIKQPNQATFMFTSGLKVNVSKLPRLTLSKDYISLLKYFTIYMYVKIFEHLGGLYIRALTLF